MVNDTTAVQIVIVGPCASGKTTLVRGLWTRGYGGARVVAQGHSGVVDWGTLFYNHCEPSMWDER